MIKSTALEVFMRLVESSIDEKGIYPPHMIMMRSDGTFDLAALAIEPMQGMQMFAAKTLMTLPMDVSKIEKPNIKAGSEYQSVIYGLDRYTRADQGTEFASVLTCWLFERDDTSPVLNIRDQYRFGVINYQHEPRIVRPMDFNNEFWNAHLREELFQFVPAITIRRRINADSFRVH